MSFNAKIEQQLPVCTGIKDARLYAHDMARISRIYQAQR
jgi:hypothetical protein